MTQQPYPQQYPGYPPQQMPQQAPQQHYPPQQYAPGYPTPAPAAPTPPPVTGTLDDFYNQPSYGGGAALKFPVVGTRYIGIVTRALIGGDIQQQTNTQGVPQFFKDGRPKWVMKVPLQMQPSQEHPDGLAQWYVKGAARDELSRAMAEAGAPEGPPEAGAVLDITFSSTRSAGVGMNDAKLFTVRYSRPQGTDAPSPAPVPQQQVQQPVAPPAPPAQPTYQQPPAQPQYQQAPPQAPVQQYAQPQALQQQAAPAPAAPEGMDPASQQLLAQLLAAKQAAGQ